jgi:hypothetical protein
VSRIVSGGQTGVDWAAMELAGRWGIDLGGWVPAGGWAEDRPEPPGVLADHPGLRETPSPDPDERTRGNVADSDAVLVLLGGDTHSPGTALTVAEAERLARHLLVADLDASDAVARIVAFVSSLPVGSTLDIAGPRESERPGVHRATIALLSAVAEALERRPPDR